MKKQYGLGTIFRLMTNIIHFRTGKLFFAPKAEPWAVEGNHVSFKNIIYLLSIENSVLNILKCLTSDVQLSGNAFD